MKDRMEYTNYLFDLYGTLVDIHTDRKEEIFWRHAAALLISYGAVYEPLKLKKRYEELVSDHELRLAQELGTDYPEIELGDVFKELLLSPPKTHKTGIWGDPGLWGEEELDRWCRSYAFAFRVMSRVRFKLYPDTIEMLECLRREGKHIYLLSNAQSLYTRPEMTELGLSSCFEDIFLSSEHRIRKPETRFMREMLDKHQLDPRESVMIGNEMKSDIWMAARCGVNAILVNHDGYTDNQIESGFMEAHAQVPSEYKGDTAFTECPDLISIVRSVPK